MKHKTYDNSTANNVNTFEHKKDNTHNIIVNTVRCYETTGGRVCVPILFPYAPDKNGCVWCMWE